jgi:5S rRNA maturation endonuclease (ribonuclease M5)
MEAERIADFLGAKKTPNGWQANCPAHEDNRASLSIKDQDNKLVLKCHAGCEFKDILAALPQDIVGPGHPGHNGFDFAPHKSPTLNSCKDGKDTHYLYLSADGVPLYRKVRRGVKDGWRIDTAMDSEGNMWDSGLHTAKRTLYNAEQLSERPKEPVFVCEGEKDADTLTTLGLLAVTNIEGASGWSAEYTRLLQKRDIVIVEDNDEAGAKRTEKLNETLQRAGCRVKVIRFRNLPPHGDVTDYVAQGHTLEDLVTIVTPAPTVPIVREPEWQVASEWMKQPVAPREIVLENVLCKGGKMVIIAPSKQRKSFFVLQMALCLSTGVQFLTFKIKKSRNILLLQYEINSDSFHERLVKSAHSLFLSEHEGLANLTVGNLRGCENTLDVVESKIRELQPEVIIFDPLYKLLDGDENQAADMKPLLRKFDALAELNNASVIYVHHDAKGVAGDRSITDRGAGSGVLQRDCDATITLTQHASDDRDLIVVDALARDFAPQDPFCARFVQDSFVVDEDAEPEVATSRSRSSRATEEIPNCEYFQSVLGRVAENIGGDLLVLGDQRGAAADDSLRGWMHKTLGLSRRKTNEIIKEMEQKADELGLEFFSGMRGRKFVKFINPEGFEMGDEDDLI